MIRQIGELFYMVIAGIFGGVIVTVLFGMLLLPGVGLESFEKVILSISLIISGALIGSILWRILEHGLD